MSILFCGGEDIDFPITTTGTTVGLNTSGTDFYRTSYARCGISPNPPFLTSGGIRSNPFAGGARTSGWLTGVVGVSGLFGTDFGLFGLGLSGTSKGLYIGVGANTGYQSIALLKFDGATWTLLQDSTVSWGNLGYTRATVGGIRFDMQVANYGTSATVTIWANIGTGTFQVLTYTGDVTVSGMAGFDSVVMWNVGTGIGFCLSEIIASDGDTRGMPGLVTLALTGQGTTDDWTAGTYSDINGKAYSDANPAYTNTIGQDEQFAVNGLPAGTWHVAAVKTTLRAAAGSGATATKVNPGWSDGTTTAFGGSATAAASSYGTLEHYDGANPVTGTSWQQADFTGLQMNLRSA
jgi:hypothetical protein